MAVLSERPAPQHKTKSPWFWILLIVILLVVLGLLLFAGWLPRHKRTEDTQRRAKEEQNATPKVKVVQVHRTPSASELMVPGSTLAYTEASIYARSNGYITKRLADIGDRVHKGQLLAVVDAPDLDQQVEQARASLLQSQSNLNEIEARLHLASLTWDRYKVLVAKGVFSRQDGDTQEANYRVAEANVRAYQNTVQAAKANLDRLIVLQQFEQVTAPFTGVVTARNIDVGALISAQGSGQGSPSTGTQFGGQTNNGGTSGVPSSAGAQPTGAQGGEMFRIAKVDILRVLTSVPEGYASVITVGQSAQLYFQEMPQAKIEGRVTRTSGSIDQNTRTLLVEVQVKNPTGRLLPGMYATVNFISAKGERPLVVPGEAIVIRDGKNVVAKVENNIVHLRPVAVGRDYGEETEIVNGVKEGDVLAVNVSDEVHDGGQITPDFGKQGAPQQAGGQSDHAGGGQAQYGEQGLANQGAQSGAKQGGESKQGGAKGGQSGGDGKK